jgi:hypothetical protein
MCSDKYGRLFKYDTFMDIFSDEGIKLICDVDDKFLCDVNNIFKQEEEKLFTIFLMDEENVLEDVDVYFQDYNALISSA